MTGLGVSLRILLRIQWASLLAFPVLIAALCLSTANALINMYPDELSRQVYADATSAFTVMQAFQGHGYDLSTYGGMLANEMGIFTLTLVPIAGIFLIISMTRNWEDKGWLNIVTSGRIDRLAPTAAAVLLTLGTCALTGALCASALVWNGIEAAGAWRYGAALALFMAMYSGIGLVAAQVARTARTAYVIAGCTFLATYLLRAVIDGRTVDLAWLSPGSWLAQMRPFGDFEVWPWVSVAFGALLLIVVGGLMVTRRDLGDGLIDPRQGPAQANRSLSNPTALVVRLTRQSGLTWILITSLVGFVLGLLSEGLAEAGQATGADSYWGTGSGLVSMTVQMAQLIALLAGCGSVQLVGLLADEESVGRAGLVLSSHATRWRWAFSGVGAVFGWTLMALGSGALASSLGLAAGTGAWTNVWDVARACVSYAPVILLIAGLSYALQGATPRLAPIGWPFLLWAAVVALRGDLLEIPNWARSVSPLYWMGKPPQDDIRWLVVSLAGAGAVALFVSGTVFFRRRSLVAG
jgi:ABC-2 type transport system permease protein